MGFSAIQLLKAFSECLLNTTQHYRHCAVLQGQREHPHGAARAGAAWCHCSRPTLEMGSVPGVCRRGLAEVRGVTGTAGATGVTA